MEKEEIQTVEQKTAETTAPDSKTQESKQSNSSSDKKKNKTKSNSGFGNKNKNKTKSDKQSKGQKVDKSLTGDRPEFAEKSTVSTVTQITSSSVSSSNFKIFEEVDLLDDAPQGSIDSTPFGIDNKDGYILLSPSLQHKAIQTKADADQDLGINMFNGRVQPTIKAKMPKYVSSRDTVIAENPVTNAKKRTNDYFPHDSKKRQLFVPVLPRTINLMTNLNVSGYIPHSSILKYGEYEDSVDSLTLKAKKPISSNDRKFHTYTYGEVQHNSISESDYNEYVDVVWGKSKNYENLPTSVKSLVHTSQAIRERVAKPDPDLKIKQIDLSFNYGPDLLSQNILEDVSTIKFMKSIHKIRYNAQDYYLKNPKLRMNLFIQDIDAINSTIVPSIEMATVLYILLDSLKSNFDFRATLGHKTGMVDSFLKFFMNKSTTWKANFEASLLKLYEVFALIPVNTEVINAWNSLKHPAISKDVELENEDVSILVPIFRVIGDFFDNELGSFEIRATINDPKYTVPYGSVLTGLLNSVRKVLSHNTYSNKIIKPGFDTMLKSEGLSTMELSTESAHADITLSAGRMTGFSADFFASLAESNRINKFLFNFLNKHFSFFEHIKLANYFSGTIFEYMTPPNIDLKMAKDIQKLSLSPFLNHLLNDQFIRIDDKPLFPLLNQSRLNNNFRDVEVHIPYDINEDKALYNLMYKGFLIDDYDKFTNSGIKANLISIVMTQSIVIPFFENQFFYPNINGEIPFKAIELQFTKGTNQRIFFLPSMCEWTSWRDEFRSQVNSKDSASHISNTGRSKFYTAHTPGFFLNSAHTKGDVMNYIKSLPLLNPSRIFYPNALLTEKLSIIPFDFFGLDKSIKISTVQPRWLYTAFSAKNVMDYDSGSEFEVDENRITLKD